MQLGHCVIEVVQNIIAVNDAEPGMGTVCILQMREIDITAAYPAAD